MIVKRYHQMTARVAAALIAEEVIQHGKSTGWSGSLEEKDEVAEILEQYNIHYTDDASGEWGFRPSVTSTEEGKFSVHVEWAGVPGTSLELCNFNWENCPPDVQLDHVARYLKYSGMPGSITIRDHRTGQERTYT